MRNPITTKRINGRVIVFNRWIPVRDFLVGLWRRFLCGVSLSKILS